MAKTKTQNTKMQQEPTVLIISNSKFKSDIEERIKLGNDILNFQVKTQSDFDSNREHFFIWSDYNSEYLKQSFNNQFNEYKKAYDDAGVWSYQVFIAGNSKTAAQKLKEFKRKVESKIKYLKTLHSKSDLIKSEVEKSDNTKKILEGEKKVITTNNIFIVHGHDDRSKLEVARTIEKLGLNPIILHEQSNQGRTIIEKFELHSEVDFAIVIMTCDDLGKAKNGKEETYRARQNVILEMGYFIGKLGRSKVFPLYEEGVELPSDLYGLLYNPIDERSTWKFQLVKELQHAGYNVDANKIL